MTPRRSNRRPKSGWALAAGIGLARRLAVNSLASYVPQPNIVRALEASSEEDLLEFARNTGGTLACASGTCKIGGSKRSDGGGRCSATRFAGLDGLRVVDASVMPMLTSGNTHVPVVMIAESASDMILADAGK